MTSPVISSRANPLIQNLRLRRRSNEWVFLEGPHLVAEALQSRLTIDQLVLVSGAADLEVGQAALRQAQHTLQVTPPVFKILSDVAAPQGILAICPTPAWDWPAFFSHAPAPLVILDGLQDPGNVGAIVRTIEASGAAGVLTTPGTARLFSPKALRGAAGSSLRVPSMEHRAIAEISEKIREAGYRLCGAVAPDGTADDFWSWDWRQPWAIVFGQEGQGLSEEWSPMMTQGLSIPMESPVESLNVGAAAAIILYQSKRHRTSDGCFI